MDHRQFQMLANNVREVFWVIDPKTLRAIYLNQAFERVTGVPLTDVLADRKAWRKVLHPEDRARVEESLDRSNAVGEPYNIEFRIVRSDGETRWIWARGEPVEDERGESMLVGVAEDITDRKRVEQELERSLSLLRATLHATADGILALDRSGRITTFNNRFVELWRIPDHVPIEAGKEEGLWNYVSDQLQDPEAFKRRRQEIERHEKSDSCDVLEFIDGRIFEVYTRPRRVGEERDGRVWSFRDTTARTRAERELRDRKRRLELYNDVLSRLARQPVKGDGREASFTEITEAAAEILEAERVSVWLFEADRNGICVADLFDRVEDRHEAGERLSRETATAYFAALADERALAIDDVRSDPRTAELRSYWERHGISAMLDAPIRADGEFVGVVCFEHIGPPRHWTIEEVGFAGSIVDLVVIALESAHRRRAELGMSFLAEAASILSSSLDYHKTIGNVADLTVPALADWCAVDVIEDGEIRRIATRHSLAAKEELLRELGRQYPPDWESSQPAAVALRTGQAKLVSEVTEGILATMTIDEGHRRLLEELGIRSYMAVPLRARNQTLGVITFASASRNFDGDHFSLAQDLAGRAATALDNAALYESAQESNRAKSNFLAVMSHELRTPLTAILGYADLMLAGVTGPPPSPKQQEHLERIKLRSLDLARIIDEILTFARLETGAEHPQAVAVDLTKVLREVTTEARPMVAEAGLELRVHIPDEPVRVETDPKRIRYILTSLISNAVRFTEHGFVEVDAERENGRVRIRVADTGIGIEPRYHEHIFEPFFQVEKATTREKGGTGLGLAVARRTARLLGGDISLESAPGRGSTFTLDLFVGNGAKLAGG